MHNAIALAQLCKRWAKKKLTNGRPEWLIIRAPMPQADLPAHTLSFCECWRFIVAKATKPQLAMGDATVEFPYKELFHNPFAKVAFANS